MQKAWGVIRGFVMRWFVVFFEAWKYDYIFVHREASPLGPPVFEWILANVLKRKIIYDFDDAIWIPNTSNENRIVGWVKAFWKVKHICAWSHKVVGGNDYLCRYALSYNRCVVKIPTCVDTIDRHNKIKSSHHQKIVIGWTGSHSTLHYLDDIIPIIEQLQRDYGFTFLVISNKRPEIQLKDWQFIPWQEKTEVEDLLKMDIGIMPLKNDDWSEGKCGFKLIQYLSLGIPAVANPVGVNSTILEDGISGFQCSTSQEWLGALKRLLTDADLRRNMGLAGRTKIVLQYSLVSQKENFLNLFT